MNDAAHADTINTFNRHFPNHRTLLRLEEAEDANQRLYIGRERQNVGFLDARAVVAARLADEMTDRWGTFLVMTDKGRASLADSAAEWARRV